MTDIVDRLRTRKSPLLYVSSSEPAESQVGTPIGLLSEAADEILSLRARIEELERALGDIHNEAAIHSSTVARNVALRARAAIGKAKP